MCKEKNSPLKILGKNSPTLSSLEKSYNPIIYLILLELFLITVCKTFLCAKNPLRTLLKLLNLRGKNKLSEKFEGNINSKFGCPWWEFSQVYRNLLKEVSWLISSPRGTKRGFLWSNLPGLVVLQRKIA